MMKDIICDFCSSPMIEFAYPAYDFVVDEAGYKSCGSWAACRECSDLIEADNRKALLVRSIITAAIGEPIPGDPFYDVTKKLHDAFFAHRKGPRMLACEVPEFDICFN